MFGIGYAIQGGVSLVRSFSKLLKQPKSVIKALVNKSNLQLGAFLGCFVGVYRVSDNGDMCFSVTINEKCVI